jgi:hypothetical protein
MPTRFRPNRSATVLRVNPLSHKLFLTFTGNAHRLMMDPVAFMKITGIVDHNILLFRDPYMAGYRRGFSEELPNLDQAIEYVHRELLGPLAHVSEIYTIGTSSGGYPALYLGLQLSVQAIWIFGGRICRVTTVDERDSALRRIFLRVTGQHLPLRISSCSFSDSELHEWTLFLRTKSGQEELRNITENPSSILDHQLLQKLVDLTWSSRHASEVNFYYSPQNKVDLHVAESFIGAPLVKLHPVHYDQGEAEDLDFLGRSSSHVVAKLLHDQGILVDVFRDYLQK